MLLPEPSPAHSTVRTTEAPGVVLDTNAVLAWLVFRDPLCAAWARRFESGSVRWLASAPMRDELAHVLARGIAGARQPDVRALWQAWEGHVTLVEPVALSGTATRIRCTDPDDQKFVDLALAHRSRWLVSRDKAVLKLARRVRPLGLDVLTPDAWASSFSAG
ncbi:PIN domain-containing protein [Piscinibacter sp. XHJ-5]|uniref:PIN domain-containing protein n=1 Tax=Piscinibacter sp. XHJ-5 TaxID=3037797 RepID=UPI0024535ECA|nr:PIN domain-containing protein [Piscinibacter sp. XHJ-5]